MEGERVRLLSMMVDIAKAVQNSQQFPGDVSGIPEELMQIIHNSPQWDHVMHNGFTMRDVYNTFGVLKNENTK